MNKIYLLGLLNLLLLGGCDIINPEEGAPTLIAVDKVDLMTEADQGASTHDIEDVWVYSNGFLGSFPIPNEVPILREGEHDVLLRWAIRPNGRAAVSQPYVFYKPLDTMLNLIPGQKIDINHSVHYTKGTKFSFVEDFESGSEVFNIDLDTIPGGITITEADVRSGLRSGKIELSSDQTRVLVRTQLFTDILEASRSIFLEMDYKNEAFIALSLTLFTPTEAKRPIEILTLKKQENWNKIYLDLTDFIFAEQATDNIIGVSILLQTALVEEETATVLLDNIKLIYE